MQKLSDRLGWKEDYEKDDKMVVKGKQDVKGFDRRMIWLC